MGILLFLGMIFLLIFLLLFWFMQHVNKKEEKKDPLFVVLVMAILFALLLTLVLAIFLFLIMGSTSVIDRVFSLQITNHQLMIIGISFFIYWLTVDNVFEILFEYLMGETIYAIGSLALSRVTSFYIIGILIKLSGDINIAISIGVSLIFFVLDMLHLYKVKPV